MTILTATGHAAAHAAIVAGVSVAVAPGVASLLRRAGGTRWAWVVWAALLLPVLMPALLVGYAYWGVSLSLVRWPWVNEALYVALMAGRFVPIAALVVYLSPPPALSEAARFCAGLGPGRRVVTARAWLTHGPGRRLAVGAGVAFLLAFQEFEVASLMGVATWTVWLFDAQVGGLSIAETLRHAALPMAVEAAVLGPLGVMVLRRERSESASEETPRRAGASVWGGMWLGAGALAVGLVPLGVVGWEVAGDAGAVARSGEIFEDVRVSLAYATTAAAGALALLWATRRAGWLRLALSLPGLLGSLVLALGSVVLFQRAALGAAYDTPAPWVATLVLLLMPLATLLALMIEAARRREALHLSRMLRESQEGAARLAGRRIGWALSGRVWFWAVALLVAVAYFDLAAGALLAPSGHTPATVTLYNLMHYGHNAVLSAMTLAAVAALVVSLGVARGLVGVWSRIPQIRPAGRASSAGLGEALGG